MTKTLLILMLGVNALSPYGDCDKPFMPGFNFMPYKNKEVAAAHRKEYNSRPEVKERMKNYNKEYKVKNRNKINEAAVKWAKKNQDKVKNYVSKRRYGIPEVEYTNILQKQKGCCAICEVSHKEFSRRMHIDHCHKSGIIRGILCVNCNTALGHFQEDANLIFKAITDDFSTLSVDSKKGFSKFCGNTEYMQKAIKYLNPHV